MSSFAGIYYLDTRPVARFPIERLLEGLTHLERNASGRWIKGTIGMVHHHLPTTPESLGETYPLMQGSGDLVLVADARIDNREELIEILGLNAKPSNQLGDGEILLEAYKKWGEQVPEKLLGDFAFAIWDEQQKALFCARDHFGIRPFYYFLSDREFFFASEISALIQIPQPHFKVNELMVAEYLTGALQDPEQTVYENILRLPSGHAMRIEPSGKKLHRYWSLDPTREVRFKSNEEYAEGFKDLFTEAVRCRLRSAFPVGSLLSGGLDSSSITCVAQNLLTLGGGEPLRTFSAVFDEIEECDERRYIDTVIAQSGIRPNFIVSDQLVPLGDFQSMVAHLDMPVFAPNLSLHWHLYKAAQEQGVRVLLDGFDGDTVVSHGLQYLNELASSRRWVSFMRETRALYKDSEESPWSIRKQYVQHFSLKPMISRSPILKFVQRLSRKIRRRHSEQWNSQTNRSNWKAVLNADFIERTGIEEGYNNWRKTQPTTALTEREGHYRSLTQGSLSLAFDLYHKATSAFRLEARYPFWDRRVVEYCLALPPQQKLYRGVTRMVLRRAMKEVIPREIEQRADKTDFFPLFRYGLRSLGIERLNETFLHTSEDFEQYVNTASFRRLCQQILEIDSQNLPQDWLTLWRVMSVQAYLNKAQPMKMLKREVITM